MSDTTETAGQKTGVSTNTTREWWSNYTWANAHSQTFNTKTDTVPGTMPNNNRGAAPAPVFSNNHDAVPATMAGNNRDAVSTSLSTDNCDVVPTTMPNNNHNAIPGSMSSTKHSASKSGMSHVVWNDEKYNISASAIKITAATPVPDVKTLRPSEQEWYPRVLVVYHYLNPSIPVYFFIQSATTPSAPPQPQTSHFTSFGVTPLGDPLSGKPDNIHFGSFLKHLDDQNPCLSPDLKVAMEVAMPKILEDRYYQQKVFGVDSLIYKDEPMIFRGSEETKGECPG